MESQPPPQYTPTGTDPAPVCTQPHKFGEIPERITCVNCKHEAITRVESKTGLGSWAVVGIIALVLLAFGLFCCVPFALFGLLLDFSKDKQHVCTNCGFVAGEKQAFF